MKTLSSAAAAALLACIGLACTGSARAETQGVSDDAIVIGTISDLSGPLASGGAPNVQGLRLRIDEANAAGGVHGRQIDLRVEDMKYDLTLAVRATNKLVKRDEIFAMISSVGTPTTMAAQKILDPQGVPTLFPVTAARSVVEPLSPLHFSLYVNYQNQAAGALKHFVAETGAKKVCLQAVANDYGQEVVDGFEATSEAMGLEVVFHGSHKVTETRSTSTPPCASWAGTSRSWATWSPTPRSWQRPETARPRGSISSRRSARPTTLTATHSAPISPPGSRRNTAPDRSPTASLATWPATCW